MTRQPDQKQETPIDDTEVEITPLSPHEQEAVAHLVEKPNLRFGGGRYANGFIVPDHIPINSVEEITPLSPQEEEEFSYLLEVPDLDFAGGRFAAGIEVPDEAFRRKRDK